MSRRLLSGGLIVVVLLVLVFLAYTVFQVPLPASGPIRALFMRLEGSPTPVAVAPGPITFWIDEEESTARYMIEENVAMTPHTVVGESHDVAGEFTIDPSNPAEMEMSAILVNARSFYTDDEFRDRAVKNRILYTDEYEFVRFEPEYYEGLPDEGRVGESYTFQMTGELTILDKSREVTWDVTVNAVSTERLEGHATTTIEYDDWGIEVPEMPFIAGVADTVQLELDFVAVAE